MEAIGRMLLMTSTAAAACGAPAEGGLFTDPGSPGAPPATMESFTIASHGDTLLARVLVAPGPGPHPQLLLLHGFPGNENNFDVAHALRRSGWNVAVVHYRGAWGSSGRFTFGSVLEDVEAAIEHLTSPGVAQALRSEAGRIYLAGHSMGGFAALYAAARRDDVAGVASLAGFNFGASAELVRRDPAERRAVTEAFAGSLAPLEAPSAEALVKEYLTAGRAWDLRAMADPLADLPVFLVAGAADAVAPPAVHHGPLVEALETAGADVRTLVLPDDHGFSASRVTLTRALHGWLESVRLGPARGGRRPGW